MTARCGIGSCTTHRASEQLRMLLREVVVRQLGGELPSDRVAHGDHGWFGPSSVAWKIHADPCLLVGGLAALLRQTLHPLAMAGVADHSAYKTDPFGRLHRTSTFIAEVVYGGTDTAQTCVAKVRRIHDRITGTTPDGRPYRANDPHLLRYVHITEIDGFLRSYERYGSGELESGEADLYVAEMARIAVELGADQVPTSVAELHRSLESYRGELAYGDQARTAVRFLRNAGGVPFHVKAAYQILFDGAAALLPQHEAELLGIGRERKRGLITNCGEYGVSLLRWILGPSPLIETAHRRVES